APLLQKQTPLLLRCLRCLQLSERLPCCALLNQYAKLSLEFCAMLLVSADGINRLPQKSLRPLLLAMMYTLAVILAHVCSIFLTQRNSARPGDAAASYYQKAAVACRPPCSLPRGGSSHWG